MILLLRDQIPPVISIMTDAPFYKSVKHSLILQSPATTNSFLIDKPLLACSLAQMMAGFELALLELKSTMLPIVLEA